MPSKKTTFDLLDVRDAVVEHWLRTGNGPDVTELANALDVSVARLRAALRASAWGGNGRLDESQVPGCKTRAGGSLGLRGTYPATWVPDEKHLRALLRGEGHRLHTWKARVEAVSMRALGGGTKTYVVNATTEVDARKLALECATRDFGPLHSNTDIYIEWIGPYPEVRPLPSTEVEHGAGI